MGKVRVAGITPGDALFLLQPPPTVDFNPSFGSGVPTIIHFTKCSATSNISPFVLKQDSKKDGKHYFLQTNSSFRRIVAMTQPISYRRGFDRFTLEPELGPVEFEMALDIEEQARASEQKKRQLKGSWEEIDDNSDNQEIHQRGNWGSIPVLESNTEPLLSTRLGHLSPNPEFRFPLESCYGDLRGADDMDPIKKSPQLCQERFDNHSQPQTPSPRYTNKADQQYSHHRYISEAESYTAHWENNILYDKDINTRVSSPGFFRLRSEYRSPYLGPVGWTIPSKYYSTTRRSPRRPLDSYEASNDENHVSTVDSRTGSPRESVRNRNTVSAYSCRASRPFLIYQDPEWVVPPQGVTDVYFDSTASDDKENSAPGEAEAPIDNEEFSSEQNMGIQVGRPAQENAGDIDGHDEMDIDGDESRIILTQPSRREMPQYQHRRDTSSISSSSII
ncbi:hypothetical protein H113_03746 [Trichophyton rubrum MR1459]|uniref:Uncharacterized protein n=2 Tax=Trichophyton TaxID=5550 RepID=F2SR25_TRIRC|nr:uncharacterized protein TERG_08846 [Trichophyton rubrum CBS 118892]EGD88793.2 hypothetical protein TERG_08846 [Trichophyton rubrum CBS 118892]EZF95991.1 hypothetical protein H113_03746 [Trichophyton rubrum MR1459]